MKHVTEYLILISGMLLGGAIVYMLLHAQAWKYWRKYYGKEVLLYFRYRPGSGQIKTYQFFRPAYSEDNVIKNALDEYNIPYKFARVIKGERVAIKGGYTKWVYTIEYWE